MNGLIAFKNQYRDNIVMNNKTNQRFAHIIQEISNINFDTESEDSLVCTVVKEYISYTRNVF